MKRRRKKTRYSESFTYGISPPLTKYSVISLSPVEGGLNLFQINGTFREFPKMLARECSWIYPRFFV